MWNPYSRSNSRSDSRNWLDAKISAQILGAFFSKLGWLPRARKFKTERSLRNDNKISLDNKICTFKILFSWRFPRKTAFFGQFSSRPHAQPPSKCKFDFYCRLAVSERQRGAVCTAGRTAGATSEKFRLIWSKLLRSCPKMRCVWWFPHKGKFWEVRGQLLKIPPKTPHKLLRRSSIRSPCCGYRFSSSEKFF